VIERIWIRFMLLFRPTIKTYDSGYCTRCKVYKGAIYYLGRTKIKGYKKKRRYIRIDGCAARPIEDGMYLTAHFFNRDLDGIEEGDKVLLGLEGDTYPYVIKEITNHRGGTGMVTVRFRWDTPRERSKDATLKTTSI